MKYISSVILLSAVLAPTGFAAIPTALPSFKSEKELTTWRSEQAAKSATVSASESSDFYTGKPYVHSSKGFAFKYRTYNPVESRWTSEDPSGFPDGANSNVYAPVPTTSVDPNGLYKLEVYNSDNRMGGNSGTVDTHWYTDDEQITSNSSVTSWGFNSDGTSGQIDGVSLGYIGTWSNWNASIVNSYTLTVDKDTGAVTFEPASGSWDNVDNDLQIAQTYKLTSLGNSIYRVTISSASIYEGVGLSGAGIAGATLSWTSGKGKVSSFASMDFKVVE